MTSCVAARGAHVVGPEPPIEIEDSGLKSWSMRPTVTLDEQTHTYLVDGVQADYSATEFIEQFHAPFDADTVLDKIRRFDLIERIETKYEWEMSATDGTRVHRYLEAYARGEITAVDFKGRTILPQVYAGMKFIKALRADPNIKLVPEFRYFVRTDKDELIAGSMDLLAVNEMARTITLYDYKTSTTIDKRSYGQFFRAPITHLPDHKLNKYALQLNLCKQMVLSAFPDHTVHLGGIVHLRPGSSDARLLEVPALEQETSLILAR